MLSVTIDAVGLITGAQLAADAGVTAGAPVVTPEGVQIAVTLADGTQQSVSVSGELEDGVPTVEAEVGRRRTTTSRTTTTTSRRSTTTTTATAPSAAAPAGHGGPEGQTGDD